MKKLFVILGLALVAAMPASAQFAWGVRGGLNVVDNDITTKANQETLLNKDTYTGYFIGPMMEFKIPVIGIGLDMALLYSQKGLEMSEGDDVKEQSIAIPVSIKGQFGLGDFLSVFVQAGPQFNYNIGDLEYQFKNTETSEVEEFLLEKSVWSLNIGGGIKVLNHLQLGVNYNLPMTEDGVYNFYDNVTEGHTASIQDIKDFSDKSEDAFKNSTLQFILTYTF